MEIEDKRGRIQEEQKYTLDPEFWNDQKKAQGVMHKIRELKRWVELYENVKREVDDAEVTYEFFKAKEASEKELEAQFKKAEDALRSFEFKFMLSARTSLSWCDHQLAVHGEQQLMLLRMYRMWAEKSGYQGRSSIIRL